MSAEAVPAEPGIEVEVIVSEAPGRWWRQRLRVHAGSTVAQACGGWADGRWRALGLQAPAPTDEDLQGGRSGALWQVGIHGRLADAAQVLREGDRIEWTRPLAVDPKEARRLRYRRDGIRPKRRRRRDAVAAPDPLSGS